MVIFYFILILIIIGISYHFLSYFYAKKLVRAGVQRGYDWYEDTGHRLMDPAAVTSVEKKRQKLEEECESFWEQGTPKTIKSYDGLKRSSIQISRINGSFAYMITEAQGKETCLI